jgi:hypothetical protein
MLRFLPSLLYSCTPIYVSVLLKEDAAAPGKRADHQNRTQGISRMGQGMIVAD